MLSACEKDTVVLPNESTFEFSEAAPKNFMAFENAKAFIKMFSKPVTEIKSLQSELFANGSFTSYSEHFASIEDNLALLEESEQLPSSLRGIEEKFDIRIVEDPEGGKMIVPAIQSPRLAAIANKNGVFQIGDAIMQVSYDLTYSVETASVSDFTDLSTSPGVQINPLSYNTKAVVEHACLRTYSANGRPHRLKTEWIHNNFWIAPENTVLPLVEIFIKIKHQKRGFLGIWFANEEDRIWTDGSITHLTQNQFGNSGFRTFPVDHEAFNSSRLIVDVLGDGVRVGSPSNWIVPTSWALHSSRDSGTRVNCFISVTN